jgi:uncharacterized protein YdaU (DUF1376 family)
VNFYRRFPGDYMRDTAELTLVQHGAYTLLLDHCYATETPLPSKKPLLYRMTRAESRSERAAVNFVVKRFFTKMAKGYTHKRVLEEIEYAKSRADAARQNGKRGGRPRKNGNPPGFSGKPSRNPAGFSAKTQWDSKQKPDPNPGHNPEKSSPDYQTPDVQNPYKTVSRFCGQVKSHSSISSLGLSPGDQPQETSHRVTLPDSEKSKVLTLPGGQS